ncbi:hypothetical protein LRY60_02460 [Candidatus Woesebacteria bacterium]|nr:hypothetical protein [Candidatus Woesebacteria bacterium]
MQKPKRSKSTTSRRKKDDEEAAFQAQLAAKQAEYDQQAQVKLAESTALVEEAKSQREAVDQQLMEQGKIDAPVTQSSNDMEIRQLEHQKPE